MINLGFGILNEKGEFVANVGELEKVNPYCNILSNHLAGTIISSNGGGWTYFENSRENKITNWSNDAQADYASEAIIISEQQYSFSISRSPIAIDSAKYSVRHAAGESEFTCEYSELLASVVEFMAHNLPIKFYSVRIKNNSAKRRSLASCLYLSLVMGDFKEYNKKFISCTKEQDFCRLTNAKNGTQAYVTAAIIIDGAISAGGNDFAINSTLKGLKGKIKATMCADELYFGTEIELNAGAEIQIIYALSANQPFKDFSNFQSIYEQSANFFNSINPIKIKTADRRMDALFNHWLMRQVLCSRFFARAGFYQAGGAVGFRDQLQDCLALLYHNPTLVRKHILDCAAHQFLAGDVQHWWHPPRLGVRTKISDDKLFLPYVLAEYIEFTGDEQILGEYVHYLEDVQIPEDKDAVFASPEISKKSESLLKHALRAIESAFVTGAHGLCLMGSGDWNDAMDKVGHLGKGESVWLSMFLCAVIKKFLPYCGEDKRGEYMKKMRELDSAINTAGWDGEWFRRAFYDDGEPLGSNANSECKIDLLCQSWATLADITFEEKKLQALNSAYSYLVDENARLIRLLDPPFTQNGKQTGYIQSYPFGVRENGGQYTHAAMWYILALLESGQTERAYKLFKMINPLNICKTQNGALRYMIEPYVLAGDVYFGEGRDGRGGWSWYTGSAAWCYKCVVEGFFGLKKKGNRLFVQPRLPKEFESCSIFLKFNDIYFDLEIIKTSNKNGIFIENIQYNCDYIILSKELCGKKVIAKFH